MAKPRVLNLGDVNSKFANMTQALQGELLGKATQAGMLIIVNRAKSTVHKITGTLSSSIHVGEPKINGTQATVKGGTNLEYARTEEFGNEFRPPHPYMRPAFDNGKDEALQEITNALRDIVRASVR